MLANTDVAELEVDGVDDAGGAGLSQHLFSLLNRTGEGLFADDVLASFEGGKGHLVMQRGGRGDGHQIDVRTIEQPAVIVVGLDTGRSRGLLGTFQVGGGNANNLDAVEVLQSGQVHLGAEAGTQDGGSDLG